jgi:hypothetical protein
MNRLLSSASAVVALAFTGLTAIAMGCSSSTGSAACTASATPGKAAFGATCCVPVDCESGVCATFAKGSNCSKACTTDLDCKDLKPLDGSAPKCGGMGVCKVGL